MAKDIKRVKSKEKIVEQLFKQLLTHRTTAGDAERVFLEKFIAIDPIYAGNLDKFDVVGTRVLWQQTVIDHVNISGHWMEFGVRGGDTIRWLLEKRPDQSIHGFDSWEGLPEEWNTGGKNYPAGAMAVPMPVFKDNVQLHQGWFDRTLEPWKMDNNGTVAYLHIDSDLYSSAVYVLNTLNDRIVPGTIIVFDELCNFRLSGKMNNWPIHEWRALCEWLEQHRRQVEPVARSCMHQAAVRVIK